MTHHFERIVTEHRIGNFGYKLIKHDPYAYTLYYLSGEDEIEYGIYKTLQSALLSANDILNIIKNP